MAKKTIAKAKVIANPLPKGSEGYYHKNNIFLKPSDKFVYEMLVHEFIENGVCLADSKETSVKEFKGYDSVKIIEKGKKRYMQSIDLVAAPMNFLVENNFKLIE